MLSKEYLLSQAGLSITDHTVAEKWQLGDPVVLQQLTSLASFCSLLSKDMEIASFEAFNKTKDRSIIADATNKGILPFAIPHRHTLNIENKSSNRVTLSQNRIIEDNSGSRIWRLLSSVTIEANSSSTVIVEQSEQREISYIVPLTEMFHRFEVKVQDDAHLSAVSLKDTLIPVNTYEYNNRWLNVLPNEKAYNILSDERQRIFIEFGESTRVGRTAQAGERYTVTIIETSGEIDTAKLKDASLEETYSTDEQKLVLSFKAGGVVQTGTNPYSTQELKFLTSYASTYDPSGVYLGDFDVAMRRKFLSRTYFLSIWNEAIQEVYYKNVDISYVNHLNVCFVAKNAEEAEQIQEQMALAIGNQDNLYKNKRVKFKEVQEVQYSLKIKGNISALHDVDTVIAQIKELLIENYGKTTLATHAWVKDGFNKQKIAKLLKDKILAFQDNMSDFSVLANTITYKPHEWVYMTNDSIQVELDRTAETLSNVWL